MPPTDPATTHLAMFRSVDAGSRSIHVAWARLTNAPDAGNRTQVVANRRPKPDAAAVPNSARMNVTPPPSTTQRRHPMSERRARPGSTSVLRMPGIDSRSPIWK